MMSKTGLLGGRRSWGWLKLFESAVMNQRLIARVKVAPRPWKLAHRVSLMVGDE